MINDILEEKLQAAGFQPGVDLFRKYMPAQCDEGVMTRIPLQGLPIDPYIPNFYKGRVQVIVRHSDPEAGARLASKVQEILTVEGREIHPETSLRGEIHLDVFQPETLPIDFPRLDGNGFEWSQHFTCVFGMKKLSI